MSDITLTMDADVSSAMRETSKFESVQTNIETKFMKVSRAANVSGNEITKFVGNLGTIAGVTAGLTTVAGALGRIDDAAIKAAESVNEIARNATSLNLLFPTPGMAPEIKGAAALQGARSGVGANESLATWQEMLSILGTNEAAARAAQEVYDLQFYGAANADARNAIAFTSASGLSPEKGSALILKGAEGSRLGVGQFATAFKGTIGWSDTFEGTAAIQALSTKKFTPEELHTYTKAAGLALEGETEFSKRMTRTLQKQGVDWTALDAGAKLDAIAANIADTSMSGLQKAGLGAEEKAMALSQLVEVRGLFKKNLPGLMDVPENYTDTSIARDLQNDPSLRRSRMALVSEQESAWQRFFGPESEVYQDSKLSAQASGRIIKSMGLANFLNNENGEAGYTGRFLTSWLTNGAAIPGTEGSREQMAGPAAMQRTEELLGQILSAVRENRNGANPVRNSAP